MSLEYCKNCNKNIDTDLELDHDLLHKLVKDYAYHNKKLKGGKENE